MAVTAQLEFCYNIWNSQLLTVAFWSWQVLDYESVDRSQQPLQYHLVLWVHEDLDTKTLSNNATVSCPLSSSCSCALAPVLWICTYLDTGLSSNAMVTIVHVSFSVGMISVHDWCMKLSSLRKRDSSCGFCVCSWSSLCKIGMTTNQSLRHRSIWRLCVRICLCIRPSQKVGMKDKNHWSQKVDMEDRNRNRYSSGQDARQIMEMSRDNRLNKGSSSGRTGRRCRCCCQDWNNGNE